MGRSEQLEISRQAFRAAQEEAFAAAEDLQTVGFLSHEDRVAETFIVER